MLSALESKQHGQKMLIQDKSYTTDIKYGIIPS